MHSHSMNNINIDQAAGSRRQKNNYLYSQNETRAFRNKASEISDSGKVIYCLAAEKQTRQRLNFINEFESSFCNLGSSCLEATLSNFQPENNSFRIILAIRCLATEREWAVAN